MTLRLGIAVAVAMRVIVNAATSADGKIALRGAKTLTLSSKEDLVRVHKLRAEVDAILVGRGTVLADDPSLLVRAELAGTKTPKQPLRVVLDSQARTPPMAKVLDGRAKTIIVTAAGVGARFPNAEVLEAGEGRVDLRLALRELAARGVKSVLVEGGATVIGAFLRAQLVDDLYVFVSPVIVGGGAPSLVEGPGATEASHVLRLRLASVEKFGDGALLHYTK
ncbi:MAG: RibD family protein [Thermoplasmatota archaeon]